MQQSLRSVICVETLNSAQCDPGHQKQAERAPVQVIESVLLL